MAGQRSKVPFHVEVTLGEGGVHVMVMFDSVVIGKERVGQIMEEFERVLKIAAAVEETSGEDLKVGDFL